MQGGESTLEDRQEKRGTHRKGAERSDVFTSRPRTHLSWSFPACSSRIKHRRWTKIEPKQRESEQKTKSREKETENRNLKVFKSEYVAPIHTTPIHTSMQIINQRNKWKRQSFFLCPLKKNKTKQFEMKKKSRTHGCTVHTDCRQDWHEDGQTILGTQTTPNYSKIITWHVTRRVDFWSTPKCTMSTVHRRGIKELAMRDIWEKLEIARAGLRSCEILALPCHSVSVVRFNVEKFVYKVWRIQWLTWWFKNFTQSKKLRMVQMKVSVDATCYSAPGLWPSRSLFVWLPMPLLICIVCSRKRVKSYTSVIFLV